MMDTQEIWNLTSSTFPMDFIIFGTTLPTDKVNCSSVVDVVEDTDCVPSEDIASILAAVISSLGIIFNILNIIIASQKSFKGSLHVYLITLSAVDALFLLIVSPLRSFRCGGCCPPPTTTAKCYEVFVYLPIGNMAVVIDTFITVTWAVQRLVYVHKPQIIEDHSSVPWKTAVIVAVFSVLIHIPFYLKHTIVDGKVTSTAFSYSEENLYYMTSLFVVTRIIPIVILVITNALLLRSVNHAIKRRASLAFESINMAEAREMFHQTKITSLLVGVVFLMIIGNTPVTLAHPPIANAIFGYEGSCIQKSKAYRHFRVAANLIEQLAFSSNFLIYYAMNNNFKKFADNLLTHVLKAVKSVSCSSRIRQNTSSVEVNESIQL